MLTKKLTNLNSGLTGPLIHASKDRIYFRAESELRILNRNAEKKENQLINSIRIDDKVSCCIKIDEESRVFIKTKKDSLSTVINCYDKDGDFICCTDLREIENYDYFNFLSNFLISFIDYKQHHAILF